MTQIKDFNTYILYGNGSVVNTRFRKPRQIIGSTTKTGYIQVKLKDEDKYRREYLHRLVAEHFIPNPHNKPHVNHINGIKSDNRVDNLEWVTAQENMNHAIANKLITPSDYHKSNHPIKLLKPFYREDRGQWILQTKRKGFEFYKSFNNIEEAEKTAKLLYIQMTM